MTAWPPGPRRDVFATVPCTAPSDLRTCDEAAGVEIESQDVTSLPVSVDARGVLVFVELDSDLRSEGTSDVLELSLVRGAPTDALQIRLR